MRAFLCLIMTVFLVNVSAFAEEEVWVFDPDEGAVVVNEDGSTEPFDSDSSILEDELPLEDPVAPDIDFEHLAGESAEDPSVDDPELEPELESGYWDSEPESFVEPEYIDDTLFPSYAVMSLNEDEPSAVLDPEERTMKDVVVMVLGEYSPKTQTVTQYLSDGSSDSYTEIVPGVAGMDWEWISGAALFGIVLFSFFKFVGVLLRNG